MFREIRALYAQGWVHPSAFREEAALKPREAELKTFVDVQAALTVIGRRSKKQRNFEELTDRLDLRACHLPGVDLRHLHFTGANFSGSCLERAWLHCVHLTGAELFGTHLEGASLDLAHLEDAWFGHKREEVTHLEGASLANAHLKRAWLDKVHLEGACLFGARGLTQKELDRAIGNDYTEIPQDLAHPGQWRKIKPEQPVFAPTIMNLTAKPPLGEKNTTDA